MTQQSTDKWIQERQAIQAIWDELMAEAKRVSKRERKPFQLAGYATGENPWCLFLLPPEADMATRLLLVEKHEDKFIANWVL